MDAGAHDGRNALLVSPRTDVCAGGHRAEMQFTCWLWGGDGGARSAAPSRGLARIPGLCLDRIDGREDLTAYEVGLKPR